LSISSRIAKLNWKNGAYPFAVEVPHFRTNPDLLGGFNSKSFLVFSLLEKMVPNDCCFSGGLNPGTGYSIFGTV
jgi:hypothetical protein